MAEQEETMTSEVSGWSLQINKERKPKNVQLDIKGMAITAKQVMRIEFYSSMQKPNESEVDFIIGKIAVCKRLDNPPNEKQLLMLIQRQLLPTNTWAYDLDITTPKDLLYVALQRDLEPSRCVESHFTPRCLYCAEGHFYDQCPVLHGIEVMRVGAISDYLSGQDSIYISLKMNDKPYLARIDTDTTHTFVKEGLILSSPDSVLEYKVLDYRNREVFARGPHTGIFEIGKFQLSNSIYELPNMQEDIVIGCDWLTNVSAILDFEEKCIYFNDWNNLKIYFSEK